MISGGGRMASVSGVSVAMVLILSVLATSAFGAPGSPPAARCNGERATIVGTPNPDRVRATKKADVIATRAGSDRIIGANQRDLVCAGSGKDRISAVGRPPRSRSRVLYAVRDRTWPEPSPSEEGAWILGPGDDYLELTCPVERPESLFHTTFPLIYGAEGNDRIIDDCSLADHISGGPGNDRLVGGAGYDSLFGSHGDDEIIDRFSAPTDCAHDLPPRNEYDTGPDYRCVFVAEGAYVSTEDFLAGGLGDDLVVAGDANDTVIGDEGNDILSGGSGIDFVSGGEGTDSCDGGPGDADSNRENWVAPFFYDCETAANFEDPPAPAE